MSFFEKDTLQIEKTDYTLLASAQIKIRKEDVMDQAKIERIQKIRDALPKKMFFETIFEQNGRAGQILKDVKIKGQVTGDNILLKSPLLDKDQEFHLFRKYNYLRYRLLKETIGFPATEETPSPKPSKPVRLEFLKESGFKRIEDLINKIAQVRNLILTSNMRLIVKQINGYTPHDSFERDEFFSNAYIHIIKAIECFDYRKKFKFSTYCVNVLQTNLWRDAQTLRKKQSVLEGYEVIAQAPSPEKDITSELNESYNKEMVEKIFELIRATMNKPEDKVEVMKGYFGIGNKDRLLLRDLGQKLNLSKERIRQIKMQVIEACQHLVYDPLV